VPRYFTLPQAESLLPEVERFLRDALFHKAEALKAHKELEETSERIRMSGGMRVNHGQIQATQTRRDSSAAALKTAMDQIEEIGAQVKDLDIGLIDFICRYQDRDVCLCWKLGESRIGFWHGLEEGFRGRKPIDQDFRSGHSGGDSSRLN
jgi:hypothetical protein